MTGPGPNSLLLSALLLSLALATSCKKVGDDRASIQASESSAVYQLRGLVKYMPDDLAEVEIHHEAIPDFVDRDGKMTGMMAMVMPFGLSKGVSMDGIAVGDKVSFTLQVDWARKPVLEITKIEKLAADTELSI